MSSLLEHDVDQLKKTKEDVTRERRLVWDKAYLAGIRESRRLLTEGIAINPDCKLLHSELVNLEAVAADFFHSRVVPRTAGAPPLDIPYNAADAVVDEKEEAKRVQWEKQRQRENQQFVRIHIIAHQSCS